MGLVAGVDSSTQSTKVVLVDTASGRVVAEASAPHQVSGSAGARETDPRQWADALSRALRGTGRAREVEAISVGAQQHGLVVLGADGQPLRPAILWNDTRSAPQAQALVEQLGGPEACAHRVGSVLTAAFTVTSWAWLREHEPAVAAQAARVCLPHDYLTSLLVGNGTLVTDRSDVSGTGWWSPQADDYDDGVLANVGLGREALPRVLGPSEAAGAVSTQAAERFGLSPGTLVGPGAGDNAGAALGLNAQVGEAVVSLGTSGTVFSVATSASADGSGIVAGFASAEGTFLPLACTLNATLAVDRTAQWLGLGRDDVAPSGGALFLPWFDGERTPNVPWASGTLSGLHHDTDPRSILQAAYEGTVGTLLGALERLQEWAPLATGAPLLLVGGGARSPVWQDTVMRLSGRPLVVPEAGELVALGAAAQAGAVLEGVGPQTVAARLHGREGTERAAVRRDDELMARITNWVAQAASTGSVALPGKPQGPAAPE